MKIDKKRPSHWVAMIAFSFMACCGLLMRPLWMRRMRRQVVFYGHKLNGNLLAVFRKMSTEDRELNPVFLSMDREYCRHLSTQGINCQWTATPGCARLLASAAAVISDHGLHSLQVLRPFYRRLGLKFFDVWHGIPFKGFDAADFTAQHEYDEIWVASELHRQLYVERYGFIPERVFITGYARTDSLITPIREDADIRQEIGGATKGKLILFAPTWAQDNDSRSIFPFGHAEEEFLGQLSALATRHGAQIIMRQHLNSGTTTDLAFDNILYLPSDRFPDTESILQVSDILICDWSSIAFDFLLLQRPTFFLNVPPPFRKGFSLGPEFRFGPIIGSLEELISELEQQMSQPESYQETYEPLQREIREKIYGTWADGNAAERCLKRLLHWIR